MIILWKILAIMGLMLLLFVILTFVCLLGLAGYAILRCVEAYIEDKCKRYEALLRHRRGEYNNNLDRLLKQS